MRGGFEFLLFPVSPARFLDEFYEKDPLHVSAPDPDRFLDLFSRRAVESLFWRHEAHLPDFVRVHNNGEDRPWPLDAGVLNYAAWVLREFQNGASIIIN